MGAKTRTHDEETKEDRTPLRERERERERQIRRSAEKIPRGPIGEDLFVTTARPPIDRAMGQRHGPLGKKLTIFEFFGRDILLLFLQALAEASSLRLIETKRLQAIR